MLFVAVEIIPKGKGPTVSWFAKALFQSHPLVFSSHPYNEHLRYVDSGRL